VRSPIMLLSLVLLLPLTFGASSKCSSTDPISPEHCKQALGSIATVGPTFADLGLDLDKHTIAGLKKVYMQRAAALDTALNYGGAIHAYDALLQLDPLDLQAHHNRGAALVNSGDFDGAAAAFECALSLDVKTELTASIMERVQDMLTLKPGYEQRLNSLWNRAKNLEFSWLSYHRGNALYGTGDFDGAVEAYGLALGLNPQHEEAHFNLGNAHHYLGNYDDAISAFDRILEREPHRTDAHNRRGRALVLKGDYNGAVAGFDRTLELAPHDTQARVDRAEALQLKELRSQLHKRWSLPRSFVLWSGLDSSNGWTFAVSLSLTLMPFCALAILIGVSHRAYTSKPSMSKYSPERVQLAIGRAASDASLSPVHRSKSATSSPSSPSNNPSRAAKAIQWADMARRREMARNEDQQIMKVPAVNQTTDEATMSNLAKRTAAMNRKAAERAKQVKYAKQMKAQKLADAVEQKAAMAAEPLTVKAPASVVQQHVGQEALAAQPVETDSNEQNSGPVTPNEAAVKVAVQTQSKPSRSMPGFSVCPMTSKTMRDPVVCSDGHTYERSNIEEWLERHTTSPSTGENLEFMHLVPNRALQKVIQEWEREMLSTAKRSIHQRTKSAPASATTAWGAATLNLRHRQQRRVSTSAAGA
jgi:lipoprotein NlpI